MGEWWWIPAAVAAGVGVHRLLVWGEARGWLYYRRRGGGGAAGMFGELMDVFQPSRQITVQETERRRRQVQQAESGAGLDDGAAEAAADDRAGSPGVQVDLDANRITIVAPEARHCDP